MNYLVLRNVVLGLLVPDWLPVGGHVAHDHGGALGIQPKAFNLKCGRRGVMTCQA